MAKGEIISLGELSERVVINEIIAAERFATTSKMMLGIGAAIIAGGYIAYVIHFSFNVIPGVVKSWLGV